MSEEALQPDYNLATDEGRSAFVLHALSKPEVRDKILELFKEVNPQAIVPEIDVKKKAMEEVEKKIEETIKSYGIPDLKEEMQKKSAELGRLIFYNQLRAKGYTDDEIQEAEKSLVDGKITDPDLALDYARRKHTPPGVVNPSLYRPHKEQSSLDLEELAKLKDRKKILQAARENAIEEFQKIVRGS